MNGILGSGFLFGVCVVLVGLRPAPTLIAAAGFGMFFPEKPLDELYLPRPSPQAGSPGNPSLDYW